MVVSLVSVRFPWSRAGFPGLDQGDRISILPIIVHLPSDSRTPVSDKRCRSVPLDVWVFRFSRCDMTSGGVT